MIDTRVLGYGGQSGVEEYAAHIIGGIIKHAGKDKLTLFHNGTRINSLPRVWTNATNVKTMNLHIPNKLLDISFGILHIPQCTRTDVVFSPHFNIVETGGVPHVMTFHDLSFIRHADFFPLRKRLWHALQRPLAYARRAARIIAVSEFTKSDLVAAGIPEKNISVVYSGIDAQFMPLNSSNQKLIRWKTSHRITFPYLLYLGTLEPRKNVTAIIRAFSIIKQNPALKDLRLVLAGARGWLYNDILRAAHCSPVSRDIILFGPVNADERVLLYNGSEAFVYPSFFEGFGLPPLEAQACGIPVVAADRTALPEILGNGARYINPWQIEKLAEAITEVLIKNTIRRTLYENGLENAKRFSWERAVKKTLDIIHESRI